MQTLNQVLAERYLQIAGKYRILETEECEKITYVIKSLLGEIEKFFMLWILFSFIGEFKFGLIGSICIISMRIFLGGTHRKTYWGCFAFSCFFFQTAYVFSQKIQFPEQFILFLWIVYVFFILFFAPLQSDKRPKFRSTTKKNLKVMSLIVISIWSLFCWKCSNDIGNYIIWLLLLQMLEIWHVLAIGVKKKFLHAYVKNLKKTQKNSNNQLHSRKMAANYFSGMHATPLDKSSYPIITLEK